MKNVDSVHGAGIQTHDLQVMKAPLALDQRSRREHYLYFNLDFVEFTSLVPLLY